MAGLPGCAFDGSLTVIGPPELENYHHLRGPLICTCFVGAVVQKPQRAINRFVRPREFSRNSMPGISTKIWRLFNFNIIGQKLRALLRECMATLVTNVTILSWLPLSHGYTG